MKNLTDLSREQLRALMETQDPRRPSHDPEILDAVCKESDRRLDASIQKVIDEQRHNIKEWRVMFFELAKQIGLLPDQKEKLTHLLDYICKDANNGVDMSLYVVQKLQELGRE